MKDESSTRTPGLLPAVPSAPVTTGQRGWLEGPPPVLPVVREQAQDATSWGPACRAGDVGVPGSPSAPAGGPAVEAAHTARARVADTDDAKGAGVGAPPGSGPRLIRACPPGDSTTGSHSALSHTIAPSPSARRGRGPPRGHA